MAQQPTVPASAPSIPRGKAEAWFFLILTGLMFAVLVFFVFGYEAPLDGLKQFTVLVLLSLFASSVLFGILASTGRLEMKLRWVAATFTGAASGFFFLMLVVAPHFLDPYVAVEYTIEANATDLYFDPDNNFPPRATNGCTAAFLEKAKEYCRVLVVYPPGERDTVLSIKTTKTIQFEGLHRADRGKRRTTLVIENGKGRAK